MLIDRKKIIPKQDNFITMRDLLAAGAICNVKDGVKLLGNVSVVATTNQLIELSLTLDFTGF
jgi:hypothetical protein